MYFISNEYMNVAWSEDKMQTTVNSLELVQSHMTPTYIRLYTYRERRHEDIYVHLSQPEENIIYQNRVDMKLTKQCIAAAAHLATSASCRTASRMTSVLRRTAQHGKHASNKMSTARCITTPTI